MVLKNHLRKKSKKMILTTHSFDKKCYKFIIKALAAPSVPMSIKVPKTIP